MINKTYDVEGLGEIGYGRAVVSTPLVPYNKLVITGNSSSARGIVKRYLSTGIYYYKVENGAWILTPKEYVWLERVLSRSPRYWVFHDSGCWKEESGPGGVRIKAYYPIVSIGNKSYMPWSGAPLLVYDSVTGALLEVGWPSGGNESSGILLLPPYVYGGLGGGVLGIASPTGLPGLELVRAVGLSKPSPGVLHSDYKRYSVAYQVSFLLLAFLLLAAVLGGWSTLPLRLIASLLVLGLVLLALTYGVVVPREQLSGVYGFNVGANGTLVFYGDRSKIININIEYSGNCTIPYNVSLVGPRGAESYVVAGNDTVLLPRLGDPGVYELVFRPAGNSSVNCSTLELLRSSVDARVTVAVDKWRGYGYYLGYAVALLAASLLLLVYFWRRGGASLDLASLLSSTIYIEIISLFMIVLYSLMYAAMRSPCKLWGACLFSHRVNVLGYLARLPEGSIVVGLVYSVVVASALFGLLLESGVDKRLLLSGVRASKLIAYKTIIGLLNIIIPIVLSVLTVQWLADPASFLSHVGSNIGFIVKLTFVMVSIVLPVYSAAMLLSIAMRRFSYGLLTGLMVALGFEYLTPPSLQPYRLILNYLFLSKPYTHLAVLGYLLLGVVLAALSVIAYWRGDFVE